MRADVRLPQRGNAYQPRVQPWENAYQPRVQPWEWNGGHGRGEWNGGRARGERIGGHGRTVPARVDNASTRAALPADALQEQHVVPRNSLFVDPALVDLTQREAA